MDINRDAAIIPPEYVLACTDVFIPLGLDPVIPYREVGIDYHEFRAQPRPLSINQLASLLEQSFEELQTPHVGLLVGQRISLTVHGKAAISAFTQPTYIETLKFASRFCEKLFPPLSMEFIETEDTVGLRTYEMISIRPHTQFVLELLAVNFYKIFHLLLGEEHQPAYFSFSYPEPNYSHIYKRYLNCPVRFDAPFSEFVVPRNIAEKPLDLANVALARIAEQEAIESIPKINLNFLPKQIRNILVQSVGAFPSLETVAGIMGVSSRTLRRQLQEHGTTFKNELETVRKEFAIYYLTRTENCITDIAYSLGYCDSSAFSNAFKKWTNLTPRAYRKRYLNHAKPAESDESVSAIISQFKILEQQAEQIENPTRSADSIKKHA
ncbi:MAG: AraC family transcriptional regulator [Pseudomonadales bacterium]|nr:AraC family transcriptional regulator [Pseudomonadales bacterium]